MSARFFCCLLGFGIVVVEAATPDSFYPQDHFIVAVGYWEGHPDRHPYGAARYRIAQVLRGTLSDQLSGTSTNESVVVLYRATTRERSLPKKAILLMTYDKRRSGELCLLAFDASAGILPDTPANRDRITKLSDIELRDSSIESWLPKEKAESLLRAEAIRRGVDFGNASSNIVRTHYGWQMSVSWHDSRNRPWLGWFEISDSGKVRRSEKREPTAFGRSPHFMPPNPAVEPTATSRGLRHQVSGCSITPSRWLLSHPSCRRSTLALAVVLSQVAVAHFVR